MAETRVSHLVETGWVFDHLSDPEIRILDATWHHPVQKRDAFAEFLGAHIPGALFFDIDAVADHSTPLPHMLAEPEHFSVAMTSLGIGPNTHVIVYDQYGLMSAPRAWWNFRAFGHHRVSVLNGGFPKWRTENRPVEAGPAKMPGRTKYPVPPILKQWIVDKNAVKDNIATPRFQLVDARSAERFAGTAPEPWPGRRSGHIPGSYNVPFDRLIDPQSGTLRPAAELHRVFNEAGVRLDQPIVTSCGSGITAAILAFALDTLGADRVAVYDGSWAEWGLPGDTPVATANDPST